MLSTMLTVREEDCVDRRFTPIMQRSWVAALRTRMRIGGGMWRYAEVVVRRDVALESGVFGDGNGDFDVPAGMLVKVTNSENRRRSWLIKYGSDMAWL